MRTRAELLDAQLIDLLRTDPDLESLRGHAGFGGLMVEMERE